MRCCSAPYRWRHSSPDSDDDGPLASVADTDAKRRLTGSTLAKHRKPRHAIRDWLLWCGAAMLAGLGGALAGRFATEDDLLQLHRSLETTASRLGDVPLLQDYGAMIALFVAGLVAGWLPAWWWASRRAKWQPLLLVDHRRPDMSLASLLVHLRQHAAGSEPEAVRLIVEAANQGTLSVWRRNASNAVRRMPRRLIEVALLRQGAGAGAVPVEQAAGDLLFFRAEVGALWPEAPLLAFPTRIAVRARNR